MKRRNDRMDDMDEVFEGIDETSGLPILSRRALIGGAAVSTLAMGGMMLLPKAEGGVLFPILNALGPEKAYALDNWSGTFTLDVVGVDEVGFLVLDADTITYDDEGIIHGTPVKNATITLTKRPEKEDSVTVTGTTDGDGKAIIKIRPVAMDDHPSDDVFYANVAVSVDTGKARVKYRDFSAGMLALEGATGCFIGVVKPDSTMVYMERCTFDDWDIHYAKNTFLRSKYNTDDHEIHVRFAGATDDVAVKLTIKDDKEKTTIWGPHTKTAKYSAKSGLAKCTFTDKWLDSYDHACIYVDEAHLCFEYTPKGQKTIAVSIPIGVQNAPIDEAKLDSSIIPFMTDENSLFEFTASGNWPCFNSLSLTVMNPHLPFQLSVTPMFVRIGIGSDVPLFDDTGKFNPGNWKEWQTAGIGRRFDATIDKQKRDWRNRNGKVMPQNRSAVDVSDPDAVDAEGNPVIDDDEKTVANKSRFLKNFNIALIARVTISLQWTGFEDESDGVKSKFEGEGCIEMGFSAGGSVTIPFQAGPLPMFFAVTLTLTALFGFVEKCSARILQTRRYLDCSKDLTYDWEDAVSILLKLTMMGSLGVGWHGVASISCDNTFEFPFLAAWDQKGRYDKSDPHITLGVTIRMEIVVQCQLFRFSGQIFSYTKKDWYDNWKGKKLAMADEGALLGDAAWTGRPARFKLTHPDGSVRHSFSCANGFGDIVDPFDTALPVTDAMMHAARDADGSQKASFTAKTIDAQAESARFVPVTNGAGIFVRRNDGIGVGGTTVYQDKLPKPVKKDNVIGTELVDCPGTNTFYFGEALSDEEMIAIAGAAAVGGSGKAKGTKTAVSTAAATGAAASARNGANADAGAASAGNGAGASVAPAAATTLIAGAAPDEARFMGDPMLGFALGSDDVYDYTPTAGKWQDAYCGSSSIRAIALGDGIVPTVDVPIFKDVYSDPRQRVVTIGGVPYLFRVATVTYTLGSNTFHRSRVVASAFNTSTHKWQPPKVIEYNSYNTDLPRDDMFDYEFDIAVRTDDQKWTRDVEACLVVVGGTRPAGDDTSIHDAFANPTVSIVLLDENLNVVDRSVQSVKDVCGEGVHMLCSPCIVDGFAIDGATGALAYAFLHRSANTASSLTKADATVTFEVGYCYVRDNYLCFPKTLKTGTGLNGSVFGVIGVTGEAVEGKYDGLFTLLFQRQGGYDVYTATIPSGGSFNDLVIKHNITGKGALPEIQPWPHHGTFLFVKSRPATETSGKPDFHLYQGSFDISAEGAHGFTPVQVDSYGFKGSSFCVSPSGEFIFYHESYSDDPGDDPAADQYSKNVALNEDGTPTGDDTVYHIVASRLINGKFCQDFPFCELSHPVDHMEVLDIDQNASTFVATHITDADNSLADLYYIAVPNTLAAEIEGFAPTGPFVYADSDCEFQVDVRNHGNLIISGFWVRMLDPDDHGNEIGRVWVGEPQPDQILMTAANADWTEVDDSETPVFVQSEEEGKGWLMPGKLTSCKATFKIPKDWEDSKNVIMCVSDAKTPGMRVDEAGGQAEFYGGENGAIAHYYHEGAENTLYMRRATGSASVQHPVEVVVDDKKDSGGGASAKPSAKTTPQTSDSLGIAEALTAALGGAAALLAGYSARRTRIEREEREGLEG